MRYIKKIFKIINSFLKSTKRLNIDAYAACTSFFLILSLMPMMILLCSILPLTAVTENDLVTMLTDLLPAIFSDLVVRLVGSVYKGGYTVLTISAAVTLWTAGKGVSSIIQGLNAVYDVEEKRNYFHKRAVCCLYTLFILGALIVSLILAVFGKTIERYLFSVWRGFEEIQGVLVRPRYLYLFILLTLVFGVLYSFLPYKKQKFREQLPGAMFSSICWLGFSYVFSLYVSMFNPYNMYGNLAMVVVAMVWIYFCLLFFMYGAYLNKYFKPVNVVLLYPGRIKKSREELEKEQIIKQREEELKLEEMRNQQDFLD